MCTVDGGNTMATHSGTLFIGPLAAPRPTKKIPLNEPITLEESTEDYVMGDVDMSDGEKSFSAMQLIRECSKCSKEIITNYTEYDAFVRDGMYNDPHEFICDACKE